jgi:acyl-coenzyme A thioesterase PaaI-like protein
MELDPVAEGVSGRFFVKQDHQGPPGAAHGGVIAAALDEAMALAATTERLDAVTERLDVALHAPARIGTFVGLEARIDRREGRRLEATAEARSEDGERVATASATFVERSETA